MDDLGVSPFQETSNCGIYAIPVYCLLGISTLSCPLDSLLNTWYQCGILKRAIPISHHRFQYEFMVIHDLDDLGVTHFRNPPCNNWYGLVFSSVFYSLAVCIHLGWSRYIIWTKQLCTPHLRHPIKNGWFPQNGWFIMKRQWKWMIWWYLISGHLHLVVKATWVALTWLLWHKTYLVL
jgi:hypothetical protein